VNGLYYFQTVPWGTAHDDGCLAFKPANGGLLLPIWPSPSSTKSSMPTM